MNEDTVGAIPPDEDNGEGATPEPGSTEGATPDTPLGEAGKAALEKERNARRDAERSVSQLRTRIAELEDAGKSELDRALAQLQRATNDLEARNTRISELEGEIQKRDLDILRKDIAEETGLPASVAKRLQGNDARELKADAMALKEELQAGVPVGDLGGGKGGAASGQRKRVEMNRLIREAAGR